METPLPSIAGETSDTLVEILDAGDAPLCVLPFQAARRQFLKFRQVAVLVYDADELVFLRKCREDEAYAGRFDLSALGPVSIGEASMDTAERLLAAFFDATPQRFDALGEVGDIPGMQQSLVETYYARFAQSHLHLHYNTELGLFTDASELMSLYEGYREMLTPALIHFIEGHLIFKEVEKEEADAPF
jgi:hypothetical protein